MPERMDGDRIIVTGYSSGSHFPREQKHMNYGWEANGDSPDGPFDVNGVGLRERPAVCRPGNDPWPGAGRGDLTLLNHSDAPQRFFGGLCAHGNIVVTGKARPIQETLNGDISKADIVVRGPVIANNISLENAIVFGKVVGERVHLVNCLVMGAVIARGQLTCTASTLFHYNANDVTFEGPCSMIHAMGDSATPPVFGTYQDGAQNLWDPDVRLYAVRRGEGTGALSNRVWEEQTSADRTSKLSPPMTGFGWTPGPRSPGRWMARWGMWTCPPSGIS